MFARVSAYRLSPGGDPEAAIKSFANFSDPIRQLEGNQGLMLLIDRETNTALTITFWETQERLHSSAEQASRLRRLAASIANVSIEDVKNYEIAIEMRA